MTTDTSTSPDDSFFEGLFQEAGWNKVAEAPANERRVEEITQRAISETIMKESTSFIFLGFSEALSAIFSAFFGSVSTSNEDYKP